MTPTYNNKFDYKPLERIDSPEGRTYVVDGKKVPSVTTILSATKDMSNIDAWKERIGTYNAEVIVKESSVIGSKMHQHLENYIMGVDRPKGSNPFHIQASKLADILIEKGLSNISEFWGSEVNLYYQNLYSGTCDLVGIYKNTVAIVDYKNTRRPKKEEHIDHYKQQIAAYKFAHDDMFGTDIKGGCILMISREQANFGEFQEFFITGLEWEKAQEGWVKTLDTYYEMVAAKDSNATANSNSKSS